MNAYDEAIHYLMEGWGTKGPHGHFSISAAHYHALRGEDAPEAHANQIMHVDGVTAVLASDCPRCKALRGEAVGK